MKLRLPELKKFLLAAAILAAGVLIGLYLRRQEPLEPAPEQNVIAERVPTGKPEAMRISEAPDPLVDTEPLVAPPSEEPTVTSPAPPPLAPKLALRQSTVSPAPDGGLRATLVFQSEVPVPLGEFFVVTRIGPGDTRIRDLACGNAESYKDMARRVSDNGRFAAVRAMAGVMEDVEVQLELSGPGVVDLRGACGLGPFDVNVSTDSVSVVPKQ